MPRLVNGSPLTTASFIEQWAQLAGVSSLLACAQRTGIRIGIWGGCVRNFVLDDRPILYDRPISEDKSSLYFTDFVDPYSDLDCVIRRSGDWPLIAQSISASVPFAGYHRWEFRTIEQVFTTANNYARIGAESFIVWHEGFDEKHQPKISLEPIEGEVDALLEAPMRRVGARNHGDQVTQEDSWQSIFDALRLARYSLQYSTDLGVDRDAQFPDRRSIQRLLEASKAQPERSHNWLRFEFALLDLLMTARALPAAFDYFRLLGGFLPSLFLERSNIFRSLSVAARIASYRPTLGFLGGLVYRQRNTAGLRLQLLTRSEETLSYGGFKGIVPWTRIWSLGDGGDDCCRHEDFKNGVAVVSWRSLNPNIIYSQSQAFDLAPAAQVTRDTPYREPIGEAVAPSGQLLSIPGVVSAGASLTLRFDHAYLAQFLGRNVQMSVGVVDPEKLQ